MHFHIEYLENCAVHKQYAKPGQRCKLLNYTGLYREVRYIATIFTLNSHYFQERLLIDRKKKKQCTKVPIFIFRKESKRNNKGNRKHEIERKSVCVCVCVRERERER